MYRFTWLSNKWQGIWMDDLEDEQENIKEFLCSGESVLLISDLEDLEDLGIDRDEVIVYE